MARSLPRHQPHAQHLLQVHRALVAVDQALALGLQLTAQQLLVARRLAGAAGRDRHGSRWGCGVAPGTATRRIVTPPAGTTVFHAQSRAAGRSARSRANGAAPVKCKRSRKLNSDYAPLVCPDLLAIRRHEPVRPGAAAGRC